MPRLLVRNLLLMLAFLSGGEALAQPAEQVDFAPRIEAAVAATGGELAALQSFKADNLDLPVGLTSEETDAMIDTLWSAYREGIIATTNPQTAALGELPPSMAELVAQAENGRIGIQSRMMPLDDFRMPFVLIRKEPSGLPEAGRPLFICTHGGGGNGKVDGPHAWNVNTREWQTQTQFAIRLYKPEGLYFVPRMADDRKGRWRHPHHQDQFELAIRHGILFWGIDPNRVYKLGISQGGFGTAILGAFMPDLFAGINPMAGGVGLGNPPENLRNVACYTSVGEKDTMFNRAPNAIATHARLDELHEQDPEGYIHHLDVQPGRGHGIDYSRGTPWIAKYSRNPYPEVVVWTSKERDGRRRPSMYWLELAGEDLKGTIALTARLNRENNSVALTANQLSQDVPQGDPTQIGEQAAEATLLTAATVSVLLNDAMLDLNKPVKITCNGEVVFNGPVKRDANTLLETLVRRGDRSFAFPVRIPIVMD